LGGLENIGYSLPGRECVYNVAMIEERHNIIGLGCGATSKYVNPDFTLTNKSSPRDVRLYLERVQQLAKIREKEISLVMET
ncbi:MAG: coproporphyrinogen dehydrogenase HemZ, partial [Dethiobacter sp.]|nr:coproporphyrinogen dehydrogenase HemZ [Dethiobacter sp.]